MQPVAGNNADRDLFQAHVVPELAMLLRVARTLVGRPADAEDLVQDTVLRAFRSIASFDGCNTRAWLLTIMRNTEINRHRRRRPVLLDDPTGNGAELAPADQGPEQQLTDPLFDSVVAQALACLPVRLRRVIELVDIDGLSYTEAATVLGVPCGTITSRLHRARTKIREQLRQGGLTTPGRQT